MHRRTVIAGLAAAPLLAALPARANPATDTLATSAGPLSITPVAHAGLILGLGAEVIYVDPARADYAALPPPTAILVTHAHGDHFDVATLLRLAGDAPILTTEEVLGRMSPGLRSRATALRNGESGSIAGLPVEAIAAYNTTEARQRYHPPGVGNGYVLSFGDTRLYVAGDTEPTPEMLALKDIAVAFLPMNLPFTMSAEQAAEAVRGFRPRIVYPYHFQGADPQILADLVGDIAEVRLRDWY